MRLIDHYSKSLHEFEVILDDARMSASTNKEEDFVKQAKQKYDEYGGRMYWSEAQDRWLRVIAGPDD